MKKLFGLMIAAGIVLAMLTAGGCDSGVIGIDRILIQAVVSSLLIFTGSYFIERGESA